MFYINFGIEGLDMSNIQHPLIVGMLRNIFLLDFPDANFYLFVLVLLLLALASRQLHVFCRPPPLPRKRLPRRPIFQVLFQPDDVSNQRINAARNGGIKKTDSTTSTDTESRASSSFERPLHFSFPHERFQRSEISTASNITTKTGFNEDDDLIGRNVENEKNNFNLNDLFIHHEMNDENSDPEIDNDNSAVPPSSSSSFFAHDLPDGFAPLLSSSKMKLLYQNLTSDLLHSIHVSSTIQLRPGRHEVPICKDASRPQLIFHVPKMGCKVSCNGLIGSEGFSKENDLDPYQSTSTRSQPMVKDATVFLDPPMLLTNVTPTLIYIPTIIEDNVIEHTLRRIRIIKVLLDLIAKLSTFIERLLWIIESRCKIHLSKITVSPVYNRSNRSSSKSQWRLNLSFSGHVLLFNWIPIPFVAVTLPSFIIPQPFALLEYLISKQPLASARIRKETISEQGLVLAALDAVDKWSLDVQGVLTPPVLGVDLTLAGGLTVAVEAMHGRDVTGGGALGGCSNGEGDNRMKGMVESNSYDTLSSCTTGQDSLPNYRRYRNNGSIYPKRQVNMFDCNTLVPWKFHVCAIGQIYKEKISVTITKAESSHDPFNSKVKEDTNRNKHYSGSHISFTGSLNICKPDLTLESHRNISGSSLNKNYSSNPQVSKLASKLHDDSSSVCSILLFPENNGVCQRSNLKKLLQYSYDFDIGKETCLEAISLCVGASHPMLKGGTIITAIMESIYAHGSFAAREAAIMNMKEPWRKRNILRHLPAVDFTAGIQNVFIPDESMSYSDDGQTVNYPELQGGQIVLRVVGGTMDEKRGENKNTNHNDYDSSNLENLCVADGVKVIMNFGIGSLVTKSEANVNEFPELDILEHQKFYSIVSGTINGRIGFHLRPQPDLRKEMIDIRNPLEAWEIDTSGSLVEFTVKEGIMTLGNKRIIIPTESKFSLSIERSVVDMALDGQTLCEFSWDFQGSSPILQCTKDGLSPAMASHEEKEQMLLLITDLRQGRFNLNVSSVGGLTITQAKTSRENRKGLYDWKFFNALVSPNNDSLGHLMNIIHDKRTMNKLLQVIGLINEQLEKLLHYIFKQVWRAKEVFDQEGVSDPGHAIPGNKMARLVSLFLSGSADQGEEIIPLIKRVVLGDGLDVVRTKELLRHNLSFYENWTAEIDRAVRWAEVMLGAAEAPKPFVESNVSPLSELRQYSAHFSGTPSANDIYTTLLDKKLLPLDPTFSNLVSRIAPYMSFSQVEYILQSRKLSDWQPPDLRRLRYVYSVKKKVLQIAESYGGLTFLPQSFFMSVFVGEATRESLRASPITQNHNSNRENRSIQSSALSELRKRRGTNDSSDCLLSPAGKIASEVDSLSYAEAVRYSISRKGDSAKIGIKREPSVNKSKSYDISDSLLGPHDVAILLQAGLTSSMKGSTVVQLNQRMLLDLMASQPKSFAVAVLAEIGGQGSPSPRGLTSALMALLDLNQSSFVEFHRLDMHQLLESWLGNSFKIPRQKNYLAGGRWARQSYYNALYGIANNILDDAEIYYAFKGHVQRVRHSIESDPVPMAQEVTLSHDDVSMNIKATKVYGFADNLLGKATETAQIKIKAADTEGAKAVTSLYESEKQVDKCSICISATKLYRDAFNACAEVLRIDKLAFQTKWFKSFYQRNYDALMVKSVYDDIVNDIDDVRKWLCALQRTQSRANINTNDKLEKVVSFDNPEESSDYDIVDGIIDLLFYDEDEKKHIREDPITRLLISNRPGHYNFTIVTAMGVITEGERGLELEAAFKRLEDVRGVITIRADTGTARSFEFNSGKIEEAIKVAAKLKRPFGLLGYSQGCSNALIAESLLLSGSPLQQNILTSNENGLVCRQLLSSAANGSMHGPGMESKMHKLIVMCEEFFKYQQGYCSKAFTSLVLDTLTNIMDSPSFQKVLAGGGSTFLHSGSKSFWREAQHLPYVPTCVMRGVLEDNTTPECLEMISNLLTKQSGSSLHDSQVHVYDAIGHPVYTLNRNSKILKNCDMGGAIQRTHHWSPLSEEVKFVQTKRDEDQGSFLCAKNRHVFPWVDVNARFGFIKYRKTSETKQT